MCGKSSLTGMSLPLFLSSSQKNSLCFLPRLIAGDELSHSHKCVSSSVHTGPSCVFKEHDSLETVPNLDLPSRSELSFASTAFVLRFCAKFVRRSGQKQRRSGKKSAARTFETVRRFGIHVHSFSDVTLLPDQ